MNGFALLDVVDFNLNPPECYCERHKEECDCDHCHAHKNHDWREWRVYPECELCENEMYEWLAQNTDYFESKETFINEYRKSA